MEFSLVFVLKRSLDGIGRRLGVAEQHLGSGHIEHWIWDIGCGEES